MKYQERAARIVVHKVRLIPEDSLFQLLGREISRVEPEIVVFAYYDRFSFQSENGRVQISNRYGSSWIDDHFYITFDESVLQPHSNPKKMRKGVTFVVKLNPGGHVLGKLLLRLDAIHPLGLDKQYNEYQLGHAVIRLGLSIKVMDMEDVPQYVSFDIGNDHRHQGFRAFMMERRRLRLAEGVDDTFFDDEANYDNDEEDQIIGKGHNNLKEQATAVSMHDVYNRALNQTGKVLDDKSSLRSDQMHTARTHFTGCHTSQADLEKDGSSPNPHVFPVSQSAQLPHAPSPAPPRRFNRSLTQTDPKRRSLQRQVSYRKDILSKVNPEFLKAHRSNSVELSGDKDFPATVWMHPVEDQTDKEKMFSNQKGNSKKGQVKKAHSFKIELPKGSTNDSSKFPSPQMILTARQLQEFQGNIPKKTISDIKEETTEDFAAQQSTQNGESFNFDMNEDQNGTHSVKNNQMSPHQLDDYQNPMSYAYHSADFIEVNDWKYRNSNKFGTSGVFTQEIQDTKSSGNVMSESQRNATNIAIIAKQAKDKGEEVQGDNHLSIESNTNLYQNYSQTPSFGDSNDVNQMEAAGNLATYGSSNIAHIEGLDTLEESLGTDTIGQHGIAPYIPRLQLDQLRWRSSEQQTSEADMEEAEIQATEVMVDAQVMNTSRLGPQLIDSMSQISCEMQDQELQLNSPDLEPIKLPLINQETQAGTPPPVSVDEYVNTTPRQLTSTETQVGKPPPVMTDAMVGSSPRLPQIDAQIQVGDPPKQLIEIATSTSPRKVVDFEAQFGEPPKVTVDTSVGNSPRVLLDTNVQVGVPLKEMVDTGTGSSPRTYADTETQVSPFQQEQFTCTSPREMVSQQLQVKPEVQEMEVQTDPMEPIVLPPPPPPPKPETVDFAVQEALPIYQNIQQESVFPMMFLVNQDPPEPPLIRTQEMEIQTDNLNQGKEDDDEAENEEEEIVVDTHKVSQPQNLSRQLGHGQSVKISIDIEEDSQTHSQIDRQLSMRTLSELSFHESTPNIRTTDKGEDPIEFPQVNFQFSGDVAHIRHTSSGKSFDTQQSQVDTSRSREVESIIFSAPESALSTQTSKVGVNKETDVQSTSDVAPQGDTLFTKSAFGSEIRLDDYIAEPQLSNSNQLDTVQEHSDPPRKSTQEMEIQTLDLEVADVTQQRGTIVDAASTVIYYPSESERMGSQDLGNQRQDSISLQTDNSAQVRATQDISIGPDDHLASTRSKSHGLDAHRHVTPISWGDDDHAEISGEDLYKASTSIGYGKAKAMCRAGVLFDTTEGLGLPESYRTSNRKRRPRKYSHLLDQDSMLTQENLRAHHARYGSETNYDWALDEEDMIRYGIGRNVYKQNRSLRHYSQDDLFQRRIGGGRSPSDLDATSGRLSPSMRKHEGSLYTSQRPQQIQPGSRPSTPGWTPGTKGYARSGEDLSGGDRKSWLRRMLGEESEERSSIRSRTKVVPPKQAIKQQEENKPPEWVALARARMQKLISMKKRQEVEQRKQVEDYSSNEVTRISERGRSVGVNSIASSADIASRGQSPVPSFGARKSPLRQSTVQRSPLIPKPQENDPKQEPEWRKIIRERKQKQQSMNSNTGQSIIQQLSPRLTRSMYQRQSSKSNSQKQTRKAIPIRNPPVLPPTPPPPPPKHTVVRAKPQSVSIEERKEEEFKKKNAPHLAGKVSALRSFFDENKRQED